MAIDVIIHEPGGPMRFPTADEAAREMEPIDVRNGEWTAWDAEGQILVPRIETRQHGRGLLRGEHEQVVLEATGRYDPDGLRDVIREWLQVLGEDAPTDLDEALEAWRRHES